MMLVEAAIGRLSERKVKWQNWTDWFIIDILAKNDSDFDTSKTWNILNEMKYT